MTRAGVEIERKYDVPMDAEPISLAGLSEQVEALPDEDLEAVYFDTSDLRLTRAGVTLRSREGGRDAGWHLKLPMAKDAREEIALPSTNSLGVPQELRDLVKSRTREESLRPVVRLHTRRSVRQLIDAEGRTLAEVTDDLVTAEVLFDPAERTQWRELETELLDGDRKLLKEAGAQLKRAGAVRSKSSSKVAHVLGPRITESGPSGIVWSYLREQVDALEAYDPAARRDVPDGVHKMRVATRRLRSVLHTFKKLLDTSVTEPLRDELKYLAAILGDARDAEVMREHLVKAVDGLPAELVVGPVIARIGHDLIEQHRRAHERLVEELNGDRYLQLLIALEAFLADPTLSAQTHEAGEKDLRPLVRRTVDRLADDAAAAEEAASAEQHDVLVHEVRKRAKQVRYAVESVTEAFGKDAERSGKRIAALQEVLGEFQDSVVAREQLRVLAVRAWEAGDDGFTFGVLHGLEQERARRALTAYPRARDQALKPGDWSWL